MEALIWIGSFVSVIAGFRAILLFMRFRRTGDSGVLVKFSYFFMAASIGLMLIGIGAITTTNL